MYKFQISTELMKNHKAAQVLSVESHFGALQTADGRALFFSIGDDSLFYLSAEQEGGATGWAPINLTADLAASFPGKTVTAKNFAVSQDLQSGDILLAQIVHVAEDNTDHLFLLPSLPAAGGAAWLTSPAARPWAARPFDAGPAPAALDIAYLNVTPHQNTTNTPYVFVGLRDAQTSFVHTYLVSVGQPPAGEQVWQKHPTGQNFDQLLGLNMGKAERALLGLYELYSLGGESSLTFTPLKGLFNAPPSPHVLSPPPGASSIATLPVDAYGHTNLYVAGQGGVYLFTPAAQAVQNDAGVRIIASELIAGVQDLEVHQSGDQVALWGRNGEGQVFYSRCPAAAQGDAASWSSPIPIEQNASRIASALNRQTQGSELYVHTEGQQVVRLTQDAETTEWRSQGILLPSLNPDDVIEFYTYTTHVTVTDENNLPLPNTAFDLTATAGPRSVYLNDRYVTLSPAAPVGAQSDAAGTLTLVQETTSLGAFCYNLAQADGTLVNVNPMSAVLSKMGDVQTGADLSAVTVTDEQGQSSPLVPASVTPDQRAATVSGIAQFVQTSKTLPQDGSAKHTAAALAACRRTFDPMTDQIWGMSFAGGDVRHFAGPDQVAGMGLSFNGDGTVSLSAPGVELRDVFGAIEAWPGDIFRWLKKEFDKAEMFFFKVIDDVTHFFVQIGETLYRVVINCITDVLHGIEFVFKKIAVAFEKLVQWVGFIFNWGDIVRTHNALRNVFNQYVQYAIRKLPDYKAAVVAEFDNLEAEIAKWGKLPDLADTIAGHAAQSAPRQGQNSPQSHYGLYHAKHNASAASITGSTDVNAGGQAEQRLSSFAELFHGLVGDLTRGFSAAESLFSGDSMKHLSVSAVVEGLIAIFADTFLDALKKLIQAAFDLIQALAEGAAGVLDAPVNIPVLSWLYKELTGRQLSLLDLACLVVAIPATIVYKLAKGHAPFPADDPFTQQVADAPDFESIQRLYASGSPQTGAPGAALSADSDARAAVLSSVFEGCAFFSSLIIAFVTTAREDDPNSKALAVLYGVLYLPYVAPNIPVSTTEQTWDVIMNEEIAGLSVAKTIADVAVTCAKKEGAVKGDWEEYSPVLEAIINGFWEIPTVGAVVRNHDVNGVVGFLGNTSFNIGGVLTPGSSTPNVLLAIGLCAMFYGICEFVVAVD